MKILIDSQEPDSMYGYFKVAGIDVERKPLPVGDYVVEEKEIVIERKTVSDFIGSFVRGHLQKQLIQMRDFRNPYLIIIGNFAEGYPYERLTTKQFCGMLASCYARFPEIKIVRVLNDDEFIKFISSLGEKIEDGEFVSVFDTELLKNKISIEDYKRGLLMFFPGIGKKKSEKLLKKQEINERIESFINWAKGEGLFK